MISPSLCTTYWPFRFCVTLISASSQTGYSSLFAVGQLCEEISTCIWHESIVLSTPWGPCHRDTRCRRSYGCQQSPVPWEWVIQAWLHIPDAFKALRSHKGGRCIPRCVPKVCRSWLRFTIRFVYEYRQRSSILGHCKLWPSVASPWFSREF